MTDHGAGHGDVKKDNHVFVDVIYNMLTSCVRASVRPLTPRHPHMSIHGMYIVAAGRLKVLPGKKSWRMDNYLWLAIKDKLLPENFRECHTNFPRYFNMVLGMHVILPNSVQIFVADEPKIMGVIKSFSNCHKVDMLDHN
jgi:hypothetical protein